MSNRCLPMRVALSHVFITFHLAKKEDKIIGEILYRHVPTINKKASNMIVFLL